MNPRKPALAFLTLALLALHPGAGRAQQMTGVALGPDGEALAGRAVLLHRVNEAGGALAATDTTDAEGQFAFELDGNEQSAYFAALRFEDEIYMGPPVRGDQTITDYVLEVSPSSSISAMTGAMGGGMPPARNPIPTTGTGESSDVGALWLVALLAIGAAAAFFLTAPRYRRRRTRDALVELATLENRLVGTEELSDTERQRLAARRARLKEQLAPNG